MFLVRSKKKIVIEFLEEVFNKKSLEIEAFHSLAKHAICRTVLGKSYKRETFREIILAWNKSFPDVHLTCDLEEYGNIVIGDVWIQETHLACYKPHLDPINYLHNPSFMFNHLLNVVPTKKKIFHKTKGVFLFNKGKISRFNFLGMNAVNFARNLDLVSAQDDFVGISALPTGVSYLKKKLESLSGSIFNLFEIKCLALVLMGLPFKTIASLLEALVYNIKHLTEKIFIRLNCTSRNQCQDLMFENDLLSCFREIAYFLFEQKE